MRLYLVFIVSSLPEEEQIKALLEKHPNYLRLDDSLIGILDEEDSYERTIELRDQITSFFNEDAHVVVFRIKGTEFAWLLSKEGSVWMKENLNHGRL